MKLNITPGPWIYHPQKYNTIDREFVSLGSIKGGDWFIAEVQNSCNENKLSGDEESEANAAVIVTAVNNTYHKGINPEAVPEMLEVLKLMCEWHEKFATWDKGENGYYKAKQLIEKATL